MTQLSPEQLDTETLNAPAPRWTPEKQGRFLEALARCGSVKAAAGIVHDDGEDFAGDMGGAMPRDAKGSTGPTSAQAVPL